MKLLRILAWSLAGLMGTGTVGLAVCGFPTPPALTTEGTPRISWKWVWKSIGQVRRIQASRRFAGWLPVQPGMLVHVGTPGAVHAVDYAGAPLRRVNGLPDRARFIVQSRITERPYLVFSVDEGGSERYLHYRFDLERGTSQALTRQASRSYVGGFDGDGRRMIYASNRRNQDDFDLYVMDVMNPTSETRVIESQGELWPAAFSPDGKSALVGRTTSHVSSRIYILDVERREMHELFADHAGRLGLWDADWSRDGRTLYLASELDGDFVGVHAFDRESGRAKLLTPNLTWDVSALELLPDGRTVALLVNEDAHGTLYLLNSITGQLVRAIGAPAGSISTIAAHPTLPLIAVDVISPLGVTGVWVYDVSAHRFSPWAVSDPDTSALPTAVTVRYPTFDFTDAGEPRTIPAVIFPAAAGFAGRRPVMIDIHGGPAMQATVAPRPHYEMIRRRGTTIIAPNVRGSRGYGKRYASLDDLTRREDAVRDIGALLDWIETRPDLDAARVSVAGGSYGGYMTLASLMHYGNRIRCGFDLFGISDFVTFLKSSEEGHYPDAQRAEFGDEHDPEMRAFLESISPARHAERIRVPLLIFQGSNDIRVRPRQSQHMVERIRAAGGTVTYVEAANEGHGLEQPLNQLYISALASEFMERCMAQPAMPPPSGMVSRLMLIREKLARQ